MSQFVFFQMVRVWFNLLVIEWVQGEDGSVGGRGDLRGQVIWFLSGVWRLDFQIFFCVCMRREVKGYRSMFCQGVRFRSGDYQVFV